MTPLDRQTLFLLYDAPDNTAQVQVVVRDETIWMTQKAMATLFDCSADNIGLHLKNIYESGELLMEATSEKISVVQQEGKRQVNPFRKFNILPDKGRISKAQADEKAEAEYDIFNRTQPITSDFDKEIKKMLANENNSK